MLVIKQKTKCDKWRPLLILVKAQASLECVSASARASAVRESEWVTDKIEWSENKEI